MDYLLLDGQLLPAQDPCLHAANHAYRYGDGLFETMKMHDGKILHHKYHFERLLNGLATIGVRQPPSFTPTYVLREILSLAAANRATDARVRLSVSTAEGPLAAESGFHYLAECFPIDLAQEQPAIHLSIFNGGRKSADLLSNLKSASHLIYAVAARKAAETGVDDCVVCNAYDRVADTTIASLFWVKDGVVYTPPLSEGCVAGVTRRRLIEQLSVSELRVTERTCVPRDLMNADEVFLTNAIRGVYAVSALDGKTFRQDVTHLIQRMFR